MEPSTESERRSEEAHLFNQADAGDSAGVTPRSPMLSEHSPNESGVAFSDSAPSGIEVLVVHSETLDPVPFARACFFDSREGTDADRLRASHDSRAFESLLRSKGRWYRSDSAGRFRVPRTPETAVLVGMDDSTYGVRFLEPGTEEPVVLEVSADPPLRICVKSESGVPVAGVPVKLLIEHDGWRTDLLRARTDEPDGVAAFLHVVPLAAARGVSGVVACLEVPLTERREVPIDLRMISSEPYALVLPETGRLEVQVRDEQGNSPSVPVFVRVAALDDRTPSSSFGVPPGKIDGSVTVEAGPTGLAHIDHVGTNLRLAVLAFHSIHEGTAPQEVRGPVRAAEMVGVEITLPESRKVTAVLVDEHGTPLLDYLFKLEFWEGDSPSPYVFFEHVRTDETGRFRTVVPRSWDRDIASISLLHAPEGMEPALGARASLPRPLEEGETDLGTLTCSSPPLIAAGIVIDADGRRVPGARVSLPEWSSSHKPGEIPEIDEGNRLRTICDHRGRFVLHGHLSGEEEEFALLVARHDGFAGFGDAVVPIGTDDASIVILERGRITGRVVGLEGSADDISLSVVSQEDGTPAWSQFVSMTDAGEFTIGRLPPGTYALQGDVFGEVDPIVTINNVTVESGQEESNPPVVVDVRRTLNHFVLHVVNGAGEPVASLEYSCSFPDGDERHGARGRGPISIATQQDRVDVTVRAPGYEPQEILGLCGERTVVLGEGLPVRLRLVDREVVPPKPYKLVAILGSDRSSPFSMPPRVPFDSDGEAVVHVSELGTYGLSLLLTADLDPDSGVVEIPVPCDNDRIELTRLDDSRERLIIVTREAVANAIDRATRGK